MLREYNAFNMNYNFFKINFFCSKLLFVSAILLGFSLPVLAADSNLRLTASPLPINLKVVPGNSVSATLKIKNDGTQAENIKVSLMKFKADSNTGTPILSDRERGDDYFDWVSFSEKNFSLPVNEWKTVTATFNVPASAAFDYYYAVVFSRSDQDIQAGDRQTVLNGGMATLVLLEAQVPGAKREIQISDFSVEKSIFEFLPANFAIKLRNTGNVHVAPRGNIFINKGEQKNIAILEVNPSQGSILPNSPRDFTEQWIDGFPYYANKTQDGKVVLDDKGNAIQELQWNFADASRLRWGRYTAKLVLVYDNGNRDEQVDAEISFWIVPWRLVFGGMLVAIFVLIGLKSTVQSWYRKIRNISSKKK